VGQLSLRGRLMVATPALADPNFDRAVVLVLQHDTDGAVGLVVNRPSDITVVAMVPEWEPLAAAPADVFVGGPVEPATLIALGREGSRDGTRVTPPASPRTGGFEPIGPGLGVIDLHAGPDEVPPEVSGIRIFAGYAGWGPGQVEEELEQGAWFVFDASHDDIVDADPATLWRRVIRRQGGTFSIFPDDPTLN
jgi:putative transcriptional regulator